MEVKTGTLIPVKQNTVITAVYTCEDDVSKLIYLSDLLLANNAGVALTLIPVGTAAGNARDGTRTPGISRNFCEALNVPAGLLNLPKKCAAKKWLASCPFIPYNNCGMN